MDLLTAIENRRSLRQFDPTHRMTLEEESRLLHLAMLSPTAFNIQHWRFVVVRDASLREQIRAVAWNQAQVTEASMLLLLCADLAAWRKDPARYWQNAPEEVQRFILPAIHSYYDGQEGVQRDEALRSCGIAAQTLMLAAQEMGYGSCPMDGFDFAAVAQLIRLPADHIISMMLAIGKPLQPPRPRAGQLPLEAVRIIDRFEG
ncbi:MAG: nitroreductase family protein [Magnetococcus sp. YQC-3]